MAMPLPAPQAPSSSTLAGRVVVITGAAGGLGRVLSLACAAQGATVVLHGRVVPERSAHHEYSLPPHPTDPSRLPLENHTPTAQDSSTAAHRTSGGAGA